ncbi:alpha/beta fold hydrolase [Nocardia sp. 2]|uniref:Alpha/beta fold hydrolase n=1 Tax=Nocardia acididurans TaxID=2802282 RepID=A0ABS1M9T1_9NOCA|nr:alpha/beta hydrolase [Nocardia acididurans]MBL1077061.1 alpha/beta fold hydrolase [Nocardia acididurans]
MGEITLELGDVTLRGTETGAGPTVLLLHAGKERREVWTPIAELLARDGWRTVAYDQRGHGESSGRLSTLREFIDDVERIVVREPAPMVVVGASLGGFAAIGALAEPAVAQRVSGLVLVDVVPAPDLYRVRPWLVERGLYEPDAAFAEDIMAAGAELLTTAAALALPVLVVRGGEKSPLRDADVDRLCAANTRVAVTRVPGAGHLVARDAPVELARILSERAAAWLRQVRPATRRR